jgi:hypothetical protein
MRNGVAKVVRLSALLAAGSALSFAALLSNCGGSEGTRAGTGGTMGGGGTTGSAGTSGSAGAAGRNMCPATQDITCGPSALTIPGGHVTAFEPNEWVPMDGKYCNTTGLRGSVFSYSGPTVDGVNISSNSHGVDATAGNFRLTLMAGSTGYAGGGLAFDSCVNASSFNAIRFSAWMTTGDQMNCTFKIQLQTFEQRPLTQSPPGGCDLAAGSCYGFPASPSMTLTTTPQTFTFPFSMLTTSATHASAFQGQIVALQWQLESGAPLDPDGGAQTACSIEVRIDDVNFLTQ